MDQKSQSLDRILESVAPVLTEAIDRVIQESLEKQEEEFQQRLEIAVREAEQSALKSAEERLERAVEDTREEVRNQVAAESKSQSDAALERATQQLKSESEASLKAAEARWSTERIKLRDDLEYWRGLAQAQRELADSRSQVDMLMRFVNLVEPFAGSVAVYVMKADGLALWKTRGSAAFPDVVSHSTIDPDSYFKAIVVREKTVAAVCAHQPYKAEPLDFLVASLARSIESFGIKLQSSAPRPAAVEVGHSR